MSNNKKPEPSPELIRDNAGDVATHIDILDQNVCALEWYLEELVQEINSASRNGQPLSDVHITLAYSFSDLMRKGMNQLLQCTLPAAKK